MSEDPGENSRLFVHHQPSAGARSAGTSTSSTGLKIVSRYDKWGRFFDSQQFTSSLRSINWSASKEVGLFVKEAYFGSFGDIVHKPVCEPIYLGDEQGYFYYLQPGIAQLRPDQSDLKIKKPHYGFSRLVFNDGSGCPIHYSFGLGFMKWSLFGPNESKISTDYKDTPFAVELDVESLTIWLVLLPFFIEEDDNIIELKEDMNVWDYLPSRSFGRPSFKMLALMKLDELGQSNDHYLFHNIAMQSRIDKMVVQQAVGEDEANQAVKKAMTSRELS